MQGRIERGGVGVIPETELFFQDGKGGGNYYISNSYWGWCWGWGLREGWPYPFGKAFGKAFIDSKQKETRVPGGPGIDQAPRTHTPPRTAAHTHATKAFPLIQSPFGKGFR